MTAAASHPRRDAARPLTASRRAGGSHSTPPAASVCPPAGPNGGVLRLPELGRGFGPGRFFVR